MTNKSIKIKGKYRVHMKGLPFSPTVKEIFFYDPNPESYLSYVIESDLSEIRKQLYTKGYTFYCFRELAEQLTEEMVHYRFPNWQRNLPLNAVGNDLLRHYLAEEDRDIGASFIRLYDEDDNVYSCYQLYHPDTYSLEDQLEFYSQNLREHYHDSIRYSMVFESRHEIPVYEGSFNFADVKFEEESERMNEVVRRIVSELHQQGVNEFVLRCLVPVEEKLSRLVVTEDYDIVLPDYDNEPIPMTPLPKAVFLLFLRHEEGISFKALADYRDELRRIYSKLTNRSSASVVDSSLDAVCDPTLNAINEKCSRIREAFLSRMDERLAERYFVTGKRGEPKRITLPRALVTWEGEI